jgi:hypothetical protein
MFIDSLILGIILTHCMGYTVSGAAIGVFIVCWIVGATISGIWGWLQNIFDDCMRINSQNRRIRGD